MPSRNTSPIAHTRIEVLLRKALSTAHFATAGSVTPQTSWTQAAWFIDPSNSTGLANDSNDGKTALKPVRTWNGGVVRKLATYAPRLRQNTTFNFLSSHTDDTDPVYFYPFIENGAQITIQGALPAAPIVGVLGAVTAKARATNTLLSFASLPAGAAVGMMVVNLSRASSRAFVYASLGGGAFGMSQPLAPVTVPMVLPPGENDGWTTGDSVQLFTLFNVNIADVRPRMENVGAGFVSALVIRQLSIWNAGGVTNVCTVGPWVSIFECDASRGVSFSEDIQSIGSVNVVQNASCANVAFRGGIAGGPYAIAALPVLTIQPFIAGGYVLLAMQLAGYRLTGDFIVGVGGGACDLTKGSLGLVAIDTGATLIVFLTSNARSGDPYLSSIIYGAGTLDVGGSCRLVYPSGAGAAVATFPISPRIQLNGGTTASAEDGGAPTTINGGITTTAAHLDAAFGPAGFGGKAFVLGGASIANLPL